MNYIKSIKLISDIFPLKAGVKVDFHKPVTVIVGDNGIGKSTLLECIRDYFGLKDDTYMRRLNMKNHISLEKVDCNFNFTYIDFHGDDRKFATAFGDNVSLQFNQMRASSGQVSISLLNSALSDLKKIENGVVIFDEPCRGQSIKNQFILLNVISGLVSKFNCQIILTTHSETMLSNLAENDYTQFFDLEKCKDTTFTLFLLDQLKAVK